MEIVLATGNEHKREELEGILKGHRLLLPRDLGVDFNCEETGKTFLENARLKAETLYSLGKRPTLADDSGLCVRALGGDPGVYSARYGSRLGKPPLSDQERNALLLKNMEGQKDRAAFFVCAMVLILGPYREFAVQETFEGQIALAPRGEGGFGYDPVFILHEGRSAAELSPLEKNLLSHRGKAGHWVAKLLETQP